MKGVRKGSTVRCEPVFREADSCYFRIRDHVSFPESRYVVVDDGIVRDLYTGYPLARRTEKKEEIAEATQDAL